MLMFYTDPHLGLNRVSHTTPASRARLRQAMFDTAREALALADNYNAQTICLGDLFDTPHNHEQTLIQGMDIGLRTNIVLAGNHDLPNRVDASSFALLEEVALDTPHRVTFVTARVGDRRVEWEETGETKLCLVPHHSSQELFEQSLNQARLQAQEHNKAQYRGLLILCLHCNYDLPWELTETSLHLTKDAAKNLLGEFDFILIGHEHIPREDFGGRLKILGNTRPTSFSDISDKYVLLLNEREQEFSTVKLFSAQARYLSVDWNELDPDNLELSQELEYIEVTGTAPATEAPRIARTIMKVWAAVPDVLMVRNAVEFTNTSEGHEVLAQEVMRMLSVPDRISAELNGTRLEQVWDKYRTQVQ